MLSSDAREVFGQVVNINFRSYLDGQRKGHEVAPSPSSSSDARELFVQIVNTSFRTYLDGQRKGHEVAPSPSSSSDARGEPETSKLPRGSNSNRKSSAKTSGRELARISGVKY